jgi:hypothetical protein
MPSHWQEAWFVSWARVLSWMLGGFYCFLFIGGCGLALEEFLALREQGALAGRNEMMLQYFSYCAVIAIIHFFFFGFPALLLAGFVRSTASKAEARQTSGNFSHRQGRSSRPIRVTRCF